MEGAALAGCGVVVAAGGLGAISLREQQRPTQRVELQFGREVTPDAVVATLNAFAGMHRFACVALEVVADHHGIRHYATSDQATIDAVRSALLAHLPGVLLQPADPMAVADVRLGAAIRLGGRLKTLRQDAPEEVSVAVLAALQPLSAQERICLRWIIRPGRPMTVVHAHDGQSVEAEDRRRLRIKNEGSIVLAHGVIAVTAGHPRRAAHLLSRLTSVLRTRNSAYGQLRCVSRPSPWVKWLFNRHSLTFGDRYACQELAGLLAWPLNAPALPGVQIGTSPRRIPASRIPSRGRVFGTATWPGSQRAIAQPIVGALSHALITGPTGVGKSTLLANLIAQDLDTGRGLVLIDGKGDTASAVLAHVPASRRENVIVLDCADPGPQPGLKLFMGASSDAELAADVVLGVLSDLYRSEWGPLSERYLRAGLVAVAHDREGTLADVPFVFTDAAYRRKLVARLQDPLTRSTFAGFESMGAAERQQQLAAPLNKLGQLLGRPIVRTVLGQANPKLNFHTVLARRQIVVISLAPARVGGPAARLIGALSVFGLFQAVQARASLAEPARRPFMVYVDEPRALGDLPMPLDALLEQARGLGVGVTLAPQSLRQLPGNVQAAALTNVATRVVFRQDADDARLLARDLSGVTPEDLGDLAAYEAVARLGLGPGDLAPPVTIRTDPPAKASGDGPALKAAAAARYGVRLQQVDEALTARHTLKPEPSSVGRKRRSS